VVSFPIAKDTCRAFIVWIAGFVFVSDAETDDNEFPVDNSFEEILYARSDSICKLVHEAILMKLLRIGAI